MTKLQSCGLLLDICGVGPAPLSSIGGIPKMTCMNMPPSVDSYVGYVALVGH